MTAINRIQRFVTGTTSARKLRSGFFVILFGVFAALFLYDGYVTYPGKNVLDLCRQLDPPPAEIPQPRESISPSLAKVLVGEKLGDVAADERLGPPAWQNGNQMAWFGPDGSLRAVSLNGVISRAEWIRGPRSASMQRWIGFILLAGTLGLLGNLVRVLLTRVTLDEDGLHIRGRRPIPFSEMVSMDANDLPTKGWIDLHLERNGRKTMLRLDNYHIEEIEGMVISICRHKQWPIPEFLAESQSNALAKETP